MKKLALILALFLFGAELFAQITVSGTVKDSNGAPIPGANIWASDNTSVGTITDGDGKYQINLPDGTVSLNFSFMGMEPQIVAINGQSVIDVVLQNLDIVFEDVVITALGIAREKKALGYSVQDVKADEITQTSNGNIVSALSGKIAGAQIVTSSGQVGASTTIKIRGNKTFYGSSSPLFVIDGTPIQNGTNDAQSAVATDFGNTAADIDPENIESISILKGASASALYGNRGLNGVVLITTKKGSKRKGIGISYTGTVAFDNVYILPNYQNSYGQGGKGSEYWWQKNSPTLTYAEYAATRFSWTPSNDWDESWGPRLDQGYNLIQFDSPVDANGNKIATPWISHPDNVKDFYETGITVTNSIALSGGNDVAMGRLSIAHSKQTGTSPNTDQEKINLGLNSTFKLGKKLKADINFNYVNTSNDNLPQQGNSMKNALFEFNGWFARQVDTKYLKEHYDEMMVGGDGKLTPVNWMTGYSTQHNNPYWIAYMNQTSRNRNRVYGNASVSYNLLEGVDLVVKVGTDAITEFRKAVFHSGTKGYAFESSTAVNGSFWDQYRIESETNADLMLNINKKINENISITSVLGANYRYSLARYSTTSALNLVVPDFFSTSAIEGEPIVSNTLYEKKSNSLFGSANISYKDYLFLDLTYRQDWSSSLSEDNWSFGYPSVNLGFIFTDAFGIESEIFSYGKLRAGYAEVGDATSAYSLLPTYYSSGSTFSSAAGDVNMFALSTQIPTFDLKPQRSQSTELGAEFKLFQNRLGIDFTYYNALTKNQIMSVPVASSSGFNSWLKNAGEINNNGIELQLYANPIKKNNFSWDLNLNWSKNNNEIVSLADGIEELIISTYYSTYNVRLKAVPGKEWGIIYGSNWDKDENGNVLIGSNGRPITASKPVEIGNVNPDFVGGFKNTFNYKAFSLSALIDYRKGGDIYSYSKAIGQKAGILESTVENNQRVDGMIAEGVYAQGVVINGVDVSGQKNTTVIAPYDYWRNSRPWAETGIVDGSFIKLREVTLNYDLPKEFISKFKIQKASVTLYARNLALLYTDKSNNVHIDPEVSTGGDVSGTGLEQYQLAPSRTIGFKLNINL